MSREPSFPSRFVQLPPEEDSTKAGRLFRSAIAAPEEPLPPITRRIRDTLGARARPARRILRMALAGAAIFLFGGVVGAAVWPHWGKPRGTVDLGSRSQPVEPVRKVKRAHPSMVGPAAAPVVAPAPMVEPSPIPPAEETKPQPAAVPKRIAYREARPVSSAASPPAVQPPAVQPVAVQPPAVQPPAVQPPSVPLRMDPPVAVTTPDEHAYLSRALRVLRDDRNATAALAVLDEYVTRFPHRALDLEAGMLRAEALLSLGRTRDALAALDGLPMQSLPKRDGRLALRGELRAAAGRFQDAIADYDAILARAGGADARGAMGDVVERALWGRASARSHLGNDEGARSDLGQYLLRFPNGRFANEAKRMLAAP